MTEAEQFEKLQITADAIKSKLAPALKSVCELLDEATAAGLAVDFTFAKVNNAWQLTTKVYKEF